MGKEYKSAALAELLKEKLPDNVSRKGVYAATGYSPACLANLDCKNSGIGWRIRIGRKIFYPREEVIKWFSERMTVEGEIALKHAWFSALG